MLLEVVEATRTEEHLAQNEQTPGVAEDAKRARHGARVAIGEWIIDHCRPTLAEWVAYSN
jgi:hypothetical protein